MIRFTAEPDDVGERADTVLARRASISRSLARRSLESGDVVVAGRKVRPSYRLQPDDVVEGNFIEPQASPPQPEEIPVSVRYADDQVLVVSKPAGLVTHPAHGHSEGTLVNALLGLGERLAGEGSSRPGIVHRLDKDTSGLLVVAKDERSHAFLVDAMSSRLIERRYLALVRGRLAAQSGTIEAPVGRHPTRRWLMAVVAGGKPAVTHYTVAGATERASLLDVKLETGRTHQIRVHLAHVRHPVLGDRTYGGVSETSRELGLTRPFLHAWRLAFPHPTGGGTVEVEDPLPEDLNEAVRRAGIPARTIPAPSG